MDEVWARIHAKDTLEQETNCDLSNTEKKAIIAKGAAAQAILDTVLKKLKEEEQMTDMMADTVCLSKLQRRAKDHAARRLEMPTPCAVKQEPISNEETPESPPLPFQESDQNGSSGGDGDGGYEQDDEPGCAPTAPAKTIDVDKEGEKARIKLGMLSKLHPNLHRLHTGQQPWPQPPVTIYAEIGRAACRERV